MMQLACARWRLGRSAGVSIGAAIFALVFCAVPCHAVITANVNVDAAIARAVMPATGLGLHTSPYYNNMSNANVDNRLNEAGVTTLRAGGGGYADIYHWSVTRSGNGITGSGLSPWFGQAGDFGYVGNGSDFGSFVRLLDQVEGGQAVVTVNYGSALNLSGNQSLVPDFGGQPKEAAAWVAYANSDPSIYGTANDIAIGIDQQGNDWKTAGYWAKLRASTAAEYQTWATTDGVFNSLNSFLAINRDPAIGIKYWEIGNETFGTGYYGGGNGYSVDYNLPYGTNRDDHVNLSPATYGQGVVEYSQLMKSIDPTIKIGAVLATPPDDYSWSYADLNDSGSKQANEPYWNDEVLTQAANDIDFVMVHWYPYIGEEYSDSNGNGTHDAGEVVNNGSTLLAVPRQKINQMINGTTAGLDSGSNRGIRDSLTAFNIPNAEIMVTEFGYFGEVWDGGTNVPTNYRTAAQSLFVADAYGSWLEQGVTSVQYLEMLTKQFLSDSGGLTRGPAFYAISMIDKLAEPGDEFVNATSSNNTVRVHAVVQDDGNVAIMILNTHVSETADVTLNIAGTTLESDGLLYTLTGGITMSGATAAASLGNSFLASVAPRSIATYIIPAIVSLPGDFNGDRVVDAADYSVWRDGLGSLYTEGNYEDWKAHFGESIPGGGSTSAAIPEPCGMALGIVACLGLMFSRRIFTRNS